MAAKIQNQFTCPCCDGHFDHWLDVHPTYREVACPICCSQPRHRALWLFLTHRSKILTTPQRVLHIAPERGLWQRFRRVPHWDYVTLDAQMPGVDIRADLCALPLPNDSFDFIICSHVLEHVIDDKAAMLELLRVLKPGGCAHLNVPVDLTRETTLEDPMITSPEERLLHYWQSDHRRLYGRDYDRVLQSAGFDVKVESFVPSLGREMISRHNLAEDEDLYFGLKKAPATQ